MILKVEVVYGDEKGVERVEWNFFENVCQPMFERNTYDKIKDSKAVKGTLIEAFQPSRVNDHTLMVRFLYYKETPQVIIFPSGRGFLMNDEGKTVERL